MMNKWAYLLIYTLPISVYISFNTTGGWSYLPIFLYFGIVPILELFIRPDSSNIAATSIDEVKNDAVFDWIVYLTMPIQVGMLIYFLLIIQHTDVFSITYFGRVLSMGLMCGVFGINIGHELGHRPNRMEQGIGEILLLTSLDTHFLPYHNSGHHKNVATPHDAATAVKGQWLYVFWIQSHFGSYIEAWKIENDRLRKQGRSMLTWSNRMVIYTVANLAILFSIFSLFGVSALVAFLIAAINGILLLETVNYIEHYGLLRTRRTDGTFEKVTHRHSWNSDHLLGRALLFNLSRHSDHHYKASKKYQILDSIAESPQMPTGYPGMMLLALFQPIWFVVMNAKLDRKNTEK